MAIKVIKGLGKAYEAFKKAGVIGDKAKMGEFKKIVNAPKTQARNIGSAILYKLKKAGVIGDKVKTGDVDFKQFKKIINKTPNKEFKQTTIGGKAQKKKIIDQATSIKRKMNAKKEEFKSPITYNDN